MLNLIDCEKVVVLPIQLRKGLHLIKWYAIQKNGVGVYIVKTRLEALELLAGVLDTQNTWTIKPVTVEV